MTPDKSKTNKKKKEECAFNQRVGSLIKTLRSSKGLSANSLAEILNVSHQQVHKYEKGKDRISIAVLNKISKEFEVPVSMFFDENTQNPSEDVKLRRFFEFSREFIQLGKQSQKHLTAFIRSINRS